jgi:hypothetical protein
LLRAGSAPPFPFNGGESYHFVPELSGVDCSERDLLDKADALRTAAVMIREPERK